MTLIERLEAVTARLEALEARSIAARLSFNSHAGLSVIREDGSVKFHWNHPSFEAQGHHSTDDACRVYPSFEEWARAMESRKGLVFA